MLKLLPGGKIIVSGEKLDMPITMAAKTQMFAFSKGVVNDVPNSSSSGDFFFQWSFGRLNSHVLIAGTEGTLDEQSLATIIQQRKLTAVYNHDKFLPGQPPTSLTPKNVKAFVPDNGEDGVLKQLMQAMNASSKCTLMWRVRIEQQKLMPHNVVCILKKACTVRPGKELDLQ